MIKLNGFFRMIHKNIDLAMSFEKIVLGICLAQFFAKTHSSTNIFEYHTQSIQFYIKLGQMDHGHLPFMSPNFDGVKGHVGVKRSNL